MKLCKDCIDREHCKSLCDEVEMYINQDYVPRQEILLPMEQLDKLPDIKAQWPEGTGVKSMFSRREEQVLGALTRGMTREEIAQQLNITRKNLREIIRRLRIKSHKIMH